jgi:hypothetical protein
MEISGWDVGNPWEIHGNPWKNEGLNGKTHLVGGAMCPS